MASMNNWLAFSLSPQELPPPQAHQNHPSPTAVSRLISGDDVSTDCYGLAADSSLGIANLRPDGPFGVLEAFNRQQQQPTQEQVTDWSFKSLEYKGSSSELSMLVGSGGSQINMDTDEPKLEDFLGGNSFSEHGQKLPGGCNSMTAAYDASADYMFSSCSLQLPAAVTLAASGRGGGGNNNGSNSSIGLSMIKTWLRNQPPPPPQHDSSSSDMVGMCGAAAGSSSVGTGVARTSHAQSLCLSMSTGSQSSSTLPLMAVSGSSGGCGESSSSADNKQKDGSGGAGLDAQSGAMVEVSRKSVDTFGQRTSIYRGVTRHRWTGRYEAHLWDNSCRREGQTRKGRQVYLGGYDKEEKAARAYDLAALKYWGTTTTTNFPISNYEKELEEMKHMTRQEFVASLRRKSSGFSRGASIYRGVTRHHQHGRWQARIGRVAGNKDLYLGTFSTQEEAAEAYDIAAIKFRGLNAVTNFDMSRYDVKSIMDSTTLPIGGASKRLGEASSHSESTVDGRRADLGDTLTSHLADGIAGYAAAHHHGWPPASFAAAQYPYGHHRGSWCKQEQDCDMAPPLQDLHHLHLGGGGAPHNFFQPSGLHNLVGVESSHMDLGSGSSSVVYGGSYPGVVAGNNAYTYPFGTVLAEQGHAGQGNGGFGENEVKQQLGYEGLFGSADPYSGRNVYYPHQSSSGAVKVNGYEQNPNCTTWMTNPVQTLHGGPTFSVWNDS